MTNEVFADDKYTDNELCCVLTQFDVNKGCVNERVNELKHLFIYERACEFNDTEHK